MSDVYNKKRMEAQDRTSPAWRVAAVERCERLFRNGQFEDVRVVGKDLLPLLGAEEQSLRLKVYLLLSRCPQAMPERQVYSALREVGAIVTAPRGAYPAIDTVRAHLLLALLHGPWTVQHPEEEIALPLRKELIEFQAIRAGAHILGDGNVSREEQMDAHVLLCLRSLDQEEIASHVEAVLLGGDEAAITQVCCGEDLLFHCATEGQYLERALACVQHPLRRVALLEAKMQAIAWRVILCDSCMGRCELAEQCGEQMTDAFAEIVLTEDVGKLGAYARLALAYYYAALDNSFAAFDNVAIVESLAKRKGDGTLQKAAEVARKSVLNILDAMPDWEEEEEEGDNDDEENDERGEEWKLEA